jgi:hypothetical protein
MSVVEFYHLRQLAKLDYEIRMLKIDIEELLSPTASDDFLFKLFFADKKTKLEMKRLERKTFIRNTGIKIDGFRILTGR